MLRHGGNRMRRTAAVFILLLVWMLLVEAGAAETTSDEAIGITLDSVDMVHIPEEQDEYLGCLRGIRIGIDPGHQEHGNSEKEAIAPDRKKTRAKVAPGTQGIKTQIPEYVTVLEISFALRDALVREGAEVYMTRETHEVNISNQERARMMNALGVDLVLRIHCNGSGCKRHRTLCQQVLSHIRGKPTGGGIHSSADGRSDWCTEAGDLSARYIYRSELVRSSLYSG